MFDDQEVYDWQGVQQEDFVWEELQEEFPEINFKNLEVDTEMRKNYRWEARMRRELLTWLQDTLIPEAWQ